MAIRKAAVNFIFVTILIDIIGFGIIIPVLPNLLAEMMEINVNEASTFGGYLITAFAIAQFIFSPIMGSLSDQHGRRPIILLSLFGFSIDYLILALAPTYGWLVIGRIIAGIFGASFTAASAYIADVSDDSNRAKNFGMLGAAFGLGFIIGPMMGGFLGEIGTRVPFYVAAALTFVNFLYGYFILPESLAPENRRPFDWKRANPVGTLKQLLSYKQIQGFLLVFLLMNLAIHAVNTNWSYFTIYRFEWSEGMIGLSLAFAGLLVAIVQAGFAQKVSDTIGEFRAILIGIALYGIGLILFAFANASWMMFAFLVPYCLGGVCGPVLKAYLASQVAANEQGELQGGLTSIQSLTTIFGPVMMTGIFFYTTKEDTSYYFPGSAFFLGAILMGISFLITYLLINRRKLNT